MNSRDNNLEKGSAMDVKIQHHECQDPMQLDEAEKALEKKTLFKLDILLVPLMCAIYLISFLDRANIGNARVAGLQEDLKLTDRQYQTGVYLSIILKDCVLIPRSNHGDLRSVHLC
jgi:hypothetical protein